MRLDWKGDNVFKKCADVVDEKLKEGAEKVARDAKSLISGRRNTGNLEKGIRVEKSRYEKGGYVVLSEVPHTMLVEMGTKRNRVAKKKKIMRWVDSKTGEEIFANIVKPMPRIPFMRPALHKNEEEIRKSFWEAVK